MECGDYGPRVRPWYVAASSGPKDVVIIIDINGSMKENGRLQLAFAAVESVLSTMNQHTFVNIVPFQTEVVLRIASSLRRSYCAVCKFPLIQFLSCLASLKKISC